MAQIEGELVSERHDSTLPSGERQAHHYAKVLETADESHRADPEQFAQGPALFDLESDLNLHPAETQRHFN
jgi:hypothetical protein